jgi:hypothetical protein
VYVLPQAVTKTLGVITLNLIYDESRIQRDVVSVLYCISYWLNGRSPKSICIDLVLDYCHLKGIIGIGYLICRNMYALAADSVA